MCKVYKKTSNLKSKCLQLHQRFINSIKLNNVVSTRCRHVTKKCQKSGKRKKAAAKFFFNFLHLYLALIQTIFHTVILFPLWWLLTLCSSCAVPISTLFPSPSHRNDVFFFAETSLKTTTMTQAQASRICGKNERWRWNFFFSVALISKLFSLLTKERSG